MTGTMQLMLAGGAGPVSVDYLIVAGGGGASSGNSGGGGGGGVLTGSLLSSSVGIGSYPVSVGAAGSYGSPTNGGDSSVFGLTAIGGGAGGYDGVSGASGGSGGGGDPVGGFGTGTSGQGFNGGTGFGSSWWGGGGGAGGVGGSAAGAPGGAAILSSISGSPVNYASGGRGAGGGDTPLSDYGTGAGGNRGIGKAGVVIIAYPTGSMTATGGAITSSGGNTIHTFTTDGTFTRTA